MNGWFARSLGSSDAAGWLFLAIGVAADVVALVMPSCAAGLWQAGQRATALVGWVVWLMTFVFAVTAGIGFASTNIADVTLSRASRITPAAQAAQAARLRSPTQWRRGIGSARTGSGGFAASAKWPLMNGAKHWTLPCKRLYRRRTRKPRRLRCTMQP